MSPLPPINLPHSEIFPDPYWAGFEEELALDPRQENLHAKVMMGEPAREGHDGSTRRARCSASGSHPALETSINMNADDQIWPLPIQHLPRVIRNGKLFGLVATCELLAYLFWGLGEGTVFQYTLDSGLDSDGTSLGIYLGRKTRTSTGALLPHLPIPSNLSACPRPQHTSWTLRPIQLRRWLSTRIGQALADHCYSSAEMRGRDVESFVSTPYSFTLRIQSPDIRASEIFVLCISSGP